MALSVILIAAILLLTLWVVIYKPKLETTPPNYFLKKSVTGVTYYLPIEFEKPFIKGQTVMWRGRECTIIRLPDSTGMVVEMEGREIIIPTYDIDSVKAVVHIPDDDIVTQWLNTLPRVKESGTHRITHVVRNRDVKKLRELLND